MACEVVYDIPCGKEGDSDTEKCVVRLSLRKLLNFGKVLSVHCCYLSIHKIIRGGFRPLEEVSGG